jgi:hypothetical protein
MKECPIQTKGMEDRDLDRFLKPLAKMKDNKVYYQMKDI